MLNYRLTLILSLITLFLTGCHTPNSAMIDHLIVGEVLINSEFKENLRALCLDGGRLSGTDNGHQAELYVAEKLREYGLRNVHLEQFEMPGWQVNHTAVSTLTDPPIVMENAVALWNCKSTPPGGLIAELIDAGRGSEEDFAALGDAVKGKLALVRMGGPRGGAKMRNALKHDAAGLIIAGRKNREPIIGGCHKQPADQPGVVIRYDDGEKLAALLEEGQTVQLKVEIQVDIWDAKPHNVVGDIPGRGPLADEIVILGAHLDSWHLGEGAIDNGNGSVTILETARALAALDWQPRRTVRFIWFMGEEQGLFGSKAYVADHPELLDNIATMVNIDMPGGPVRFGHFGHPELEPFLHTIETRLRGYDLDEARDYNKVEWSDHAPFMNAGLPTLTLSGDLGDGGVNYHTLNDKFDCVDRRKTIHSAAVLGVLMRHLADEDERVGEREVVTGD